MPITRTSLPADLEEGLNAHFGRSYRDHPEEWRKVFDIENSNRAFEEDVLQSGFGAAIRKPEGGMITYDEIQEGWMARYNHDTYGLAFAITEEAIDDNLYERQAPKNARALARALQHAKEIKGAAILNNAFSGSYTGGDGVALCSTAHPAIMGANWSNKLATPADLSEESLEDISILVMTATDDRNVPINLMVKSVVVPPQLVFEATRILRSTQRTGTSDNDINAINYMGMFSGDAALCKVTRLTDPDAWFVRTDCPESMKHFVRKRVQRGMQEDFNTGNYLYKAWERYSFGWSDPRGIYGSEGA